MDMQKEDLVGEYIIQKWRARLADCGDVQHVARQMRKQGYPIEIALLILTERELENVRLRAE